MEIPDWLMEKIMTVLDDHPDVTHIVVNTDTRGGWKLDYCTSKTSAINIKNSYKDQENTDIIDVVEE